VKETLVYLNEFIEIIEIFGFELLEKLKFMF